MEGLAPPLELLLRCREAIDRGLSVKTGVRNYLTTATGEFPVQVAQWLQSVENQSGLSEILARIESPHRRLLLEILTRGIEKEAISSHLQDLEIELLEVCEDEISRKLAYLPYQMMIPLLVFMFPAFLLLLLGPFLSQFLENMK